MKFNGGLRLAIAFALGIGTAVAGVYTTFETTAAHSRDVDRIERTLEEIRDDIKELLKRNADK